MQARLSSGARKLLHKLGCSQLTVHLVETETGCSIGFAREVRVDCEYPKDSAPYHPLEADGVTVYVDPRLKVQGRIVIKKQGFWKFSGLYADGVQIPI